MKLINELRKLQKIEKHTWIGFGAFMTVLLVIGLRILYLDDDPSAVWWQDFWVIVWSFVLYSMIDFMMNFPLTKYAVPFLLKGFIWLVIKVLSLFKKK